jgi:hypothetical protein
MELTAKQTKILAAWPTAYDTAEDAKSDLGSTWTDVAELANNTGMTQASVRGVLGSLVNLGLAQTGEGGDGNPAQCLTEDGVDAVYALRGTAVQDTTADAAAAVKPHVVELIQAVKTHGLNHKNAKWRAIFTEWDDDKLAELVDGAKDAQNAVRRVWLAAKKQVGAQSQVGQEDI